MSQWLIVLLVAIVVAAIVFGVVVMITGDDPGLGPAEPDASAVPLPGDRPLTEQDLATVRFDTALRGYRMAQVDQALRRAAYDLGYKEELIAVLEAELTAVRAGRMHEADNLRRVREASAPSGTAAQTTAPPLLGPLVTRTKQAGTEATGSTTDTEEAAHTVAAKDGTQAVPVAPASPQVGTEPPSVTAPGPLEVATSGPNRVDAHEQPELAADAALPEDTADVERDPVDTGRSNR